MIFAILYLSLIDIHSQLNEKERKLYYYVDSIETTHRKPLGFIDIALAKSIHPIASKTNSNGQIEWEFAIESRVGEGGRVYKLRASSEYEMT